MSDHVKLYGVNADGSTTLLGEALQTPAMKITEIITDWHGHYDPEDFSAASDMHHAMHQFLDWLKKVGYITQPIVGVTPV